MYITGHLDSVFSEEHRKEILRYIYYHQVSLPFFLYEYDVGKYILV